MSDAATLAQGLFVSHLQASERANAETIREVIDAALAKYGHDGCAALVAYEFGEHPDDSARRMMWARRAVRDSIATRRAI